MEDLMKQLKDSITSLYDTLLEQSHVIIADNYGDIIRISEGDIEPEDDRLIMLIAGIVLAYHHMRGVDELE